MENANEQITVSQPWALIKLCVLTPSTPSEAGAFHFTKKIGLIGFTVIKQISPFQFEIGDLDAS